MNNHDNLLVSIIKTVIFSTVILFSASRCKMAGNFLDLPLGGVLV